MMKLEFVEGAEDSPAARFAREHPGVIQKISMAVLKNGSFGKDHVIVVVPKKGQWMIGAVTRDDFLKKPPPFLPVEAIDTVREPAPPCFLHVLVCEPSGDGFTMQTGEPHRMGVS